MRSFLKTTVKTDVVIHPYSETIQGNLTWKILHFLTVHHVMILGKWPAWCTNYFICICFYLNKYIEKNLCITLVTYQESDLEVADYVTTSIFDWYLAKLRYRKFITIRNRCTSNLCLFVCFWRSSPQWARASSLSRFLDQTQRRTTVGRTSLDEWSVRRRDLYLTTHNIHNRQTAMPPVGFEHTISAGERQQTLALHRVSTGTD
jgi:hypothetical protein